MDDVKKDFVVMRLLMRRYTRASLRHSPNHFMRDVSHDTLSKENKN